MRECVTCLLGFVLRTSRSNLLRDCLELNLCLCLHEIVGKTKTSLSSEGPCFLDRHFLPIFKNLFLFCFCSSFSVNGTITKSFVIFIFTPLNRLRSYVRYRYCFRSSKNTAPIYQAIFEVKTSAQFCPEIWSDEIFLCGYAFCFMKNEWHRELRLLVNCIFVVGAFKSYQVQFEILVCVCYYTVKYSTLRF